MLSYAPTHDKWRKHDEIITQSKSHEGCGRIGCFYIFKLSLRPLGPITNLSLLICWLNIFTFCVNKQNKISLGTRDKFNTHRLTGWCKIKLLTPPCVCVCQYLLCVPGFSGQVGAVVHQQTGSGQDAEQWRAVEQRLHGVQPAHHLWEALVRAEVGQQEAGSRNRSSATLRKHL